MSRYLFRAVQTLGFIAGCAVLGAALAQLQLGAFGPIVQALAKALQ